jgi:ribosomal protein L11 methyltransferase
MLSSPTDVLQFSIAVAPEWAGYLSQLLWGLDDVQGVVECYRPIPDGDDRIESVQVLTQSPETLQTLQAILAEDELLAPLGLSVSAPQVISESDWVDAWKRFWHVSRLTPRITVRPSWEDYAPTEPDEIVIDLDPGVAFGTGSHDTTRLMLRALDQLASERDFSQMSVLDVGTGSGILAIAAAKLGSRSVLGIDNDPLALPAAEENVARNGLSDRVTISGTPLQTLCPHRHELILANIIAPVILELMPEMLSRLTENGALLLSGIVASALPKIEEALQANGLNKIIATQEGSWFAVRAER